jgi:hypothetical protein
MFFTINIAHLQRAHNIGLFRQAFEQKGYPIDVWSDEDIERAIPAMYQAIGELNMAHDAMLKQVQPEWRRVGEQSWQREPPKAEPTKD